MLFFSDIFCLKNGLKSRLAFIGLLFERKSVQIKYQLKSITYNLMNSIHLCLSFISLYYLRLKENSETKARNGKKFNEIIDFEKTS